MESSIHGALAAWANFYLVTGSAAAALTGLQFVVQTLLSSDSLRRASGADPEGGIAAFGTPTVVHFTLALIISATLCIPWLHFVSLRAALGTLGISALVYSCVVLRRTQRQRTYTPEAEDWIFHIILPFIADLALVGAAVLLDSERTTPLFAVAFATLVLLCVGIHNAWDTVTYLTVVAIRGQQVGEQSHPSPAPRTSQKMNRQCR